MPRQRKPNDLSRSLIALDMDTTLIAVVELSLSSWLVAGIVPGVERQPLKKLKTDENALLTLLNRWRDEAVRSGHKISRIAVAFEAGRPWCGGTTGVFFGAPPLSRPVMEHRGPALIGIVARGTGLRARGLGSRVGPRPLFDDRGWGHFRLRVAGSIQTAQLVRIVARRHDRRRLARRRQALSDPAEQSRPGTEAKEWTFRNVMKGELDELGANATVRVTALQTWLQGTIGPELAKSLCSGLFSEKQVRALELLANKHSSQGAASFRQDGREPHGQPGRVSEEQWSGMSAAERWNYARGFDQKQFNGR
jgi:hypothetical protein